MNSVTGKSTPIAEAVTAMPKLGWVLLPGLTLLWGVNWPILKVGLSEIPLFTFRTVTAFVAAAGLFAIARAYGQSLRVPVSQWRGLAVAAILNMALWNVLMFYGIMYMDSGRAAILGYTMPLWATLAGMLLLGDRPTRRQTFGLVSGLCGMAVLVIADARNIGAAPLGALSIIAAAACWGAGTVALKYYRFTLPTAVLTGWQQLIGGIPILLCALVLELGEIGPVSLLPALALAYNAVIASLFCYWAFFTIVAITPVVMSTVSTLMVPVVGVVSGALLLGETPGIDTFLALALVVIAIAAVVFPGRPVKA